MPRTVIANDPDGHPVEYDNVPDNVSDEEVRSRAYHDYMAEKRREQTSQTVSGLAKAAHAGATAGARALNEDMRGAEKYLPPPQRLMLEGMRRLTPESQDKAPLNAEVLASDYEPQTTAEKYVRSGAASAVHMLPLGGWHPMQLSANVLSGLLGEAGGQAGLPGWQTQLLSAAPQLGLTLAHLLKPQIAAHDLQTAVKKAGPEAVAQGQRTAARAKAQGVDLLPGQAIPPPVGVTKGPVETLTQEVAGRPGGVPIHEALRGQDAQVTALEAWKRAQVDPRYAQGSRAFPSANDPARQATELEMMLLGSGRGVGSGTAADKAIRQAQGLAGQNIIPRPGATRAPSSYTAINDTAADLYAKGQQAIAQGDSTAGKFLSEASIKLRRLANTNPDVREANRIVAEVSDVLEQAKRARGGLSRANPIGAAEVATSPAATAGAAAVSGATSGPAAAGFPILRSIRERSRLSADRQLARALADPTWEQFFNLRDQAKTPQLIIDALRAYQSSHLHGE